MQVTQSKKRNRVTISVPKDIDLDFRKRAAIKFSFTRGWYGKAILEAIELWITHHTKKDQDISEATKEHLWNSIKDKIRIDTEDPQHIVESIVKHFKNIKYVEDIRYEMDKNKIIIRKKNPLESYIPYLVTHKDESILLNCPVKSVVDAALKDLTELDYEIDSNESTLLYVWEEPKSLGKEIIREKAPAAYSSQFL